MYRYLQKTGHSVYVYNYSFTWQYTIDIYVIILKWLDNIPLCGCATIYLAKLRFGGLVCFQFFSKLNNAKRNLWLLDG